MGFLIYNKYQRFSKKYKEKQVNNNTQLKKKLTLNKKTISNLDINELNLVKGGATLKCGTSACPTTATISCDGIACMTESCTWFDPYC